VDGRNNRCGTQDVVAVSPRWVGLPLYLLLGWVAICFAGSLLDGGGPIVVGLLVLGGVLYNVGAILYGLRWPNPWPHTFGYHEFFHAFAQLRR
jgi:hemolysin III